MLRNRSLPQHQSMHRNRSTTILEITVVTILLLFLIVNDGLQSIDDEGGDDNEMKTKSSLLPWIGSRKAIPADSRIWGYFPGLDPRLGFSEFMDEFFESQNCSMRFFMVWNTPPWSYTVRYQRGLESILYYHSDACVVVFSETLELSFFQDFVDYGYKVAMVKPNLDKLLKNTPVHVSASIWHKWRAGPLFHIHYSELLRLLALYKYGGTYVDSDVVLLRPLQLPNSYVGLERHENGDMFLNGAVMAFDSNSPFILECLKEFSSTYNKTGVRWNGADLLTRVAARTNQPVEFDVVPTSKFFPITSQKIRRYFEAPNDDVRKFKHGVLFQMILRESYAFHFWNSDTYMLVPQQGSIAAKLINHRCLRCNVVM